MSKNALNVIGLIISEIRLSHSNEGFTCIEKNNTKKGELDFQSQGSGFEPEFT